jgi:hypothetical protein
MRKRLMVLSVLIAITGLSSITFAMGTTQTARPIAIPGNPHPTTTVN